MHVNGKTKRAKGVILISGKTDFRSKTATKNKEGHYRTMKVLFIRKIQQSQLYMLSISQHQSRVSKSEGRNGQYNSSREFQYYIFNNKLITQTENQTLDQTNLRDTYRAFCPTAAEYTFSSTHKTFSRADHVLGHKTNLSKCKETGNMPSIFSDHNGMKL